MYYIVLVVLLLVFSGICYLFGINMNSMSEGTQNLMITIIGSTLALLGSIILQQTNERVKSNNKVKSNMMLLNKELVNNFMVCFFRIKQNDAVIPFFVDTYNHLISQEERFKSSKNNKDCEKILSDLYFLIQRGDNGLITFSDFYERVFEQQKKSPENEEEMLSIIEAMGIDNIYEFAIIKQIILINYYLELHLDLAFYDFRKILEYHDVKPDNLNEEILIYITDLLCKKYYDQPTYYYISCSKKNNLEKNNIKLEQINEAEVQCQADAIKELIESGVAVVDRMYRNSMLIQSLDNFTENTISVEHKRYEDIVDFLDQLYRENTFAYLVYVGSTKNEDAIDNYGRSRQNECINGIRKSYEVSKRSWYLEMETNNKYPAVLSPTLDTSGSYIISIVSPLKNPESNVIGVIGIDITIATLAKCITLPNHFMIVTTFGEIVYDSMPKAKGDMSCKYNIKMFIPKEIVCEIFKENTGSMSFRKDRKTHTVSYASIVQGKYYLVFI